MGKIVTVAMPDIGEGVVEGEVIQWLKQVGDSLSQDEPVVIVMTDKATVELPSPHPGRLVKQYFQVGKIAIKDKPLYDIEIDADVPETSVETPAPVKSVIKEAPAVSPKAVPISRSSGTHAAAAPPTRKLAHDLGVDIDAVLATGKEGHVTNEDVIHRHAGLSKETAAAHLWKLPGDREEPLIGVRNLMAKRMAESKANIPHFSYFEQLDATHLVQLRHHFKEEAAKEGIAVTYMPFIIKALSMSLSVYPTVNSSFDASNHTVVIHQQHNIGVAISTQNGLIVPVLKNAQELTLPQLIKAYEDLKRRALTNKLQSSEMKEATITVSNFGTLGGAGLGGLWATPIINYPEAAILALSRIHKQPIAKSDNIVICDVLNLSWSFDHRIIDGELAAAFSHHMSALLQNPAPLLP